MSRSFKKFKPKQKEAKESTQTWFDDFPKEPIGGSNPYWMCSYCERSVPEINYCLEGHMPYCEYRKMKEKEQ